MAVLFLRELLVTKTWDGYLRFQVMSVGPDFLSVDSIPGTAESADESAPQTDDVHDYIPVLPGASTGATVRCRVEQTYRANTDFDSGPHSTITNCVLVSGRGS